MSADIIHQRSWKQFSSEFPAERCEKRDEESKTQMRVQLSIVFSIQNSNESWSWSDSDKSEEFDPHSVNENDPSFIVAENLVTSNPASVQVNLGKCWKVSES